MTKKNSEKADSVLTEDGKYTDKAAFALASIEKAGEAIFWVDKTARFVDVNEAGCRHLGYDKDELLSLRVFDIDPYFPRERWLDFWKELREKKSISFEVLHRHKSGRLFPAELRLNYIKIGDREYSFAFATDISERKQVGNAMADLSHGLYSSVGENYFKLAVKYLSKSLKADYVYIAEFVGSDRARARTVAILADGNIIDNLEVDLAGTPCETVVGMDVCSYPSGVQKRFPGAHMMASLAVQAYCGSTLTDSNGEHLGILTVMYRQPIAHTDMIESVLKIFAARTSAELERIRSERMLKESEARYRDIIENSLLGISVYTESGQCILSNSALVDIVGVPAAQILSSNFFEIQSWKESGLLDSAQKALALGVKEKKTVHAVTSVGKELWLKSVFVPYCEREEKLLMHLVEDVTAQKKAEKSLERAKNDLEVKVKERTTDLKRINEELQIEIERHKETERNLVENESKFRKLSHEFNTLLDAIPDRLVLLSPDLKILWSNRAFDSEINKQSEKSHEQTCYRICFNLSEPCDDCPVLKSFKTCSEESTQVRDSEGRVFDKRAFPVMDETGQVVNVIEVSRDITAKIRLEEEARLVQSRLIHANKMTSLGTLVAGVAHEINNPNSYIMSNTEMFCEIWKDAVKFLNQADDDRKPSGLGGIPFSELVQLTPALLDGIKEGSLRIKNIIQGLINFARPDISALDGEIDIEKTVSTSQIILNNHINKLTNKFHVEFEKNLPPVKGSAKQIEQVIINLIMNALQALPHRDAGIRISGFFDKNDEIVVVKVKDEGVGIPADIMQNITDPFFTTRSDNGGTGLGLSISYAIVKDHKGELLFESKEGEGTTVTLTLPAKNKMK